MDGKLTVGNISGQWSKCMIDSTEYVIKFNVKAEQDDQVSAVTCWLSDFKSIWYETIAADEMIERSKKCNPLLACGELITQMIPTFVAVPKQSNNIQLTELHANDLLHLKTKYFLSDGSDQIPLKFYWSLDKVTTESFFVVFNEMLLKISDLQKANEFLSKELRNVKIDNPNENGNESIDNDVSAKNSSVPHEGIFCNGCGNDIVGHRYSCIECDDFDLCMICEHEKKQHTHHIMIRYAQPGDNIRSKQLFCLIKGRNHTKRIRNSRR